MPVRPRKLLVEGETDKHVIPYLMEANGVEWPDRNDPDCPAFIKSYGSVNEILKPGVIEGELRASGLEALGLVVDADSDAAARWGEVKALCDTEFANLPDKIPAGGLEVVHTSGPRFGVWIMPDNRFDGMLEDLLVQLIPEDSSALYQRAQRCVAEARADHAPFKNVHESKARVYTWLAWQDPPGLRLHEAVKHQVLEPTRPESRPFVQWFKNLFRV